MNGLDLFSGIGGIALALKQWVRTKAYCEIDPYCQAVLLSRMHSGEIERAPIWDDVRTFPVSDLGDFIDIVCGGFPCQDISVAGAGKGLAGERSGLFYEILKIASHVKPRFIFLENVPAITTRGGTEVVREITAMGYDCRWCVISAASVGALHRRERWFLLAHALNNGTSSCQDGRSARECAAQRQGSQVEEKSIGKVERTSCLSTDVAHAFSSVSRGRSIVGQTSNEVGRSCSTQCTCLQPENWKACSDNFEQSGSNVAHTNGTGCGEQCGTESIQEKQPSAECCCHAGNANCEPSEQTDQGTKSEQTGKGTWGGSSGQYWPFESREHWQEVVSEMGKCSDGVSNHVARLRALGNSVVPQQVQEAFKILMGL